MSGHSKWATIKRKKGATDSKRSKMFSRIAKEIQVAVREGGNSLPDLNPKLRLAINNARGINMPKENIERAINSASKDTASLEEVNFEGYLQNGIAVFIECLTDNNNRSVSSVRSIFTKKNGNMGTKGSLAFIFDRKGIFTIPIKDRNQDDLQLELIDAGADDVELEGEYFIAYTSLENFASMQKKLEELKIEVENAELKRIPNDTKKLSVEESIKILKTIEDFEELEDVQNVYHNLEVTDEIMSKIE